ncbi:unnamed protein product [Diatraea saccharalis]|uniref:Uncharacterized protein n=1 Tax=Diatraea saccharalis TaxID=40085 RepID=A0A9N9WKA8_9NEOP|nr:unnamed protein product [Diatraea saccharalis]
MKACYLPLPHYLPQKHLSIPGLSFVSIKTYYRLGIAVEGKTCPVVIRFTRSDALRNVWRSKSKLKRSFAVLSEFLTKARQVLFQDTLRHIGMTNVWTLGSNIYIKTPNDSRVMVHTPEDLQILNKHHQKCVFELRFKCN